MGYFNHFKNKTLANELAMVSTILCATLVIKCIIELKLSVFTDNLAKVAFLHLHSAG